MSLARVKMARELLLVCLNFSTLLACAVLKVPQIALLTRSRSSKGISVRGVILELLGATVVISLAEHVLNVLIQFCLFFGPHRKPLSCSATKPPPLYIVFTTYEIYHEYPLMTYLEYPVLIAQDTVLFLLILHYSGNLKQSLFYSLILVGGSQLLTLKSWIIDSAMSLCTVISASSRFAQLQCLWQTKDAGQLSALTWAMSTYTCMARILTTVLTSGDLKVLLRFVVMTTLNGWVLVTVVFYKWNDQKLK